MKKKFTQIGVTALRGPDGSFLPAVPLYVESDRLEDLRTPGRPGGRARRHNRDFFGKIQTVHRRQAGRGGLTAAHTRT